MIGRGSDTGIAAFAMCQFSLSIRRVSMRCDNGVYGMMKTGGRGDAGVDVFIRCNRRMRQSESGG